MLMKPKAEKRERTRGGGVSKTGTDTFTAKTLESIVEVAHRIGLLHHCFKNNKSFKTAEWT